MSSLFEDIGKTIGEVGTGMISGVSGGMFNLQNPLSATEPEQPVKVDVTAKLDGGAMTGINFGGEGTNWIIVLGIVAAIFFLSKSKK